MSIFTRIAGSAILIALCSFGLADTLKLGATTTTENSGLLEYLFPFFEADTGHTVDYIAAGSSAALRMGRNNQVDALLVHSPDDEQEYMTQGYGVRRDFVFFNDFVLVGPRLLSQNTSMTEVLLDVSQNELTFVSRADYSGTHKKEQELWDAIDFNPIGEIWYIEVGQGMGATLDMAEEEQAFLVIDRGTWIARGDQSPLQIVYENDPALMNPYSVIVNPGAQAALANVFADWLLSNRAQQLISEFRIDEKILFKPFAEY